MESGQEFGGQREDDFAIAAAAGIPDLAGGLLRAQRETGQRIGDAEPGKFFFVLALHFDMANAAGAQQAGAHGSHRNAVLPQLGPEAFG